MLGKALCSPSPRVYFPRRPWSWESVGSHFLLLKAKKVKGTKHLFQSVSVVEMKKKMSPISLYKAAKRAVRTIITPVLPRTFVFPPGWKMSWVCCLRRKTGLGSSRLSKAGIGQLEPPSRQKPRRQLLCRLL